MYTAASKKIDLLNVPLKFMIHDAMGDCHCNLGSNKEALRSYEKAFSGREILLGIRHYKTLESLYSMIRANYSLGQNAEVLRLCGKIFIGQDSVPELDVKHNLGLQISRSSAYRCVDDHNKAAHTKKYLQAALKKYHESHSNDDCKSLYVQFLIGRAYNELGDYDTALESFQLALEAYKKLNGPNDTMTLHTQYWIAGVYDMLGRFYEAKELYEIVYVKQQRFLGPNHSYTRWTKAALESLTFDDDHSSECSSLSSWQPSSTNF